MTRRGGEQIEDCQNDIDDQGERTALVFLSEKNLFDLAQPATKILTHEMVA
jgi:hypothetical protein